jgi:hypothetical protein
MHFFVQVIYIMLLYYEFIRYRTEYASPSSRLKTKTNPVSETLSFLVIRIPGLDKVQEASNSKHYAQSSESFRFHLEVDHDAFVIALQHFLLG